MFVWQAPSAYVQQYQGLFGCFFNTWPVTIGSQQRLFTNILYHKNYYLVFLNQNLGEAHVSFSGRSFHIPVANHLPWFVTYSWTRVLLLAFQSNLMGPGLPCRDALHAQLTTAMRRCHAFLLYLTSASQEAKTRPTLEICNRPLTCVPNKPILTRNENRIKLLHASTHEVATRLSTTSRLSRFQTRHREW
jgi:hypothetical protein